MDPLVAEFLNLLAPDLIYIEHLTAAIAARREALEQEDCGSRWQPGEVLKLLLVGYCGEGNLGADVRVAEIARQLYAIFGSNQLQIGVMSSERYFVKQAFPQVIVEKRQKQNLLSYLPELVSRYHGAIACEGSLFKSTFSDYFSATMLGALGFAALEHKVSVAYGVEAGQMSEELSSFALQHCRNTLTFARSTGSQDRLQTLGLRTELGTDTAWTFASAPDSRGREILRAAGWDGYWPVMAICPINPFWWPVRPDLTQLYDLSSRPELRQYQYSTGLFHHYSPDAERKYEAYLDGMAQAISIFYQEARVFPVVVGMERIDRRACTHLVERLPGKVPVFIYSDWGMYDLVSLLRQCQILVSSRFHAIVLSMPAQIPAIGVSMDERITNLFADRGCPHWVLSASAPDLAESLLARLRSLYAEREAVAPAIGQFVALQVQRLGTMGMQLAAELCRIYPQLSPMLPASIWRAYLPPLPETLTQLLNSHL